MRLPICLAALLLLPAFPDRVRGESLNESQTLNLLVRTIADCDDPDTQAALLGGMLKGLEGRRDVAAPQGWNQLSEKLGGSDKQSLVDQVRRLSQIFGDQEAIGQSLAVLRDGSVSVDRRREALAALVARQHAPAALLLPELLKTPELEIDAIRAYSVLSNPQAPKLLLRGFSQKPEDVRRAIVETLASRQEYMLSLLSALKSETVSRDDVPSYVARSMNDVLGNAFLEVYGDIPQLGKDVGQAIAKFKSLITDEALEAADAGRGRVVFAKTCGACHLMYGEGGKIGPDLTGSNRANLDYLLLNSVAPSADVPEGYRTQLIQTVDGRILTGVVAEEDNQRVVLKTVEQPRLVIAKSDIEARKVSDKSMMPEGQLDQLSKQQLFDLVKYMQTKSQVEAAQ